MCEQAVNGTQSRLGEPTGTGINIALGYGAMMKPEMSL